MHVIFDLDSTLTTIEGIDELGALKGKRQQIEQLTNEAMKGALPLETVFEERLKIIKPTLQDLMYVGELYVQNCTPYATEVIATLQKNHTVSIVTGGYFESAQHIAKHLGVENLYANKILFDETGAYVGLDRSIPLYKKNGKAQILDVIRKNDSSPTVMIGDGISDFEAGADTFIYFAGVVKRQEVINKSEHVVHDLRDIFQYV